MESITIGDLCFFDSQDLKKDAINGSGSNDYSAVYDTSHNSAKDSSRQTHYSIGHKSYTARVEAGVSSSVAAALAAGIAVRGSAYASTWTASGASA